MVTLILLAISLILLETIRDASIMIEPILVSQEIANMGYTPEIMARRLKDSADGNHPDEVTNIKETILSYRYRELDIVLPEVGISIKSVSRYFRDFFRRNITIISGEMLYHEEQNQISFRLRLNSEQIFDEFESFSEKGIIMLIKDAGYELTKSVNPFALAVYHYRKDEKLKTQEIVNYIIKNVDKAKYDFARAVNLKGVLHHNDGEYKEAISHYKWANELDPSFSAPYTNWSKILAKQGDYNGAFKKIQEANKVDPNNVSTYVYWCSVLVSQINPDWKGAINKCKKALKLDPDNASAYINWGVALRKKREPDLQGAIKKFKEALKLDPNNVPARINLGVGLMRKREPDMPGAIEQFQEALKLEPNNVSARINLGIGLMSDREPDMSRAIEQFQEALKLEPNNVSARINLGIGLMRKREPDMPGAIEQFQEALKLEPNNVSARINLGIGLMSDREPDMSGAIEQFKEVLKLEPDNAFAHLMWGDVLMSMRNWYGAIEKYKKVIKLKPMSDVAYNSISLALIKLGKNDIATKMQNCVHKIRDSNEQLKCSKLVLSL